jgi:hypothetical protein
MMSEFQGTGLDYDVASAGLRDLGGGTAFLELTVPQAATVAYVFWAGRDRPCPESLNACVIPSQPYKDQQMTFNGNPITGTVVGTEQQPATPSGQTNNIAYRANVTTLVNGVGPGTHDFQLSDGDDDEDLDVLSGATLLAVFPRPGDSTQSRIIVLHGLDFAHGDDPTPGATRSTAPGSISHGAFGAARTGRLTIVTGGGTAAGTDRLDVTANTSIGNCLTGDDGPEWSEITVPVTVPAGASATQVSLASPAGGGDALLWTLAILMTKQQGSVAGVSDDCPDLDADGTVDAFDADDDGDGVDDADEPRLGTDPRAADTDGDGVSDGADNCPALANADQANADGLADGGDACEADDDEDGHADRVDTCPLAANAVQLDIDGDGLGVPCDPMEVALPGPVPVPPPAAGACVNGIVGTARGQTLTGTAAGDLVLGGGGNDVLNGVAGDDCLYGEAGRDRLNGGDGRDLLVGGPAVNRYAGGAGNDAVLARNRRRETIRCGPGTDTAIADRRDRAVGCERVRRPRRRG